MKAWLYAYLLDARSVILLKAAGNTVCRSLNIAQFRAICVLGLCAHAGNGYELGILLHALLQLAKEYAETSSIVGRPERAGKGRHDCGMGAVVLELAVQLGLGVGRRGRSSSNQKERR